MDPLLELKKYSFLLNTDNIANLLLDNPDFSTWSGSSKPEQHHYGTGQLLIHTHEVVIMCMDMQQKWYPHLNRKALFLASLLHDWGKLWDYALIDGKWGSSDHKYKIHHISRSAIEWSKAVEKTGECRDIESEVTHAILAHHGLREWGSPVSPKTQIAWLLHLCDGISARMNDCEGKQ